MRAKTREVSPSTNGKMAITKLRADELRIDPKAQRAIRANWVRALSDNFRPELLGIVHVSHRGNSYYVIDGQHRVMACRLHGEPERLLDCIVHEGFTVADDAAHFRGLNKQLNVRLYDDFRVSLTAGDVEAVAINTIVESVGLSISDQSEDGKVTAVKACQEVFRGKPMRAKEPTPWALSRALRTATGAWGQNRDGLAGVMLLGLGAVHLRYGDDIELEELERKLAKFNGGPLGVLNRAKIRREMTNSTVWKAVAEVVVDIYNKGRRTTALPDFRR